jgi:hypothetical protein
VSDFSSLVRASGGLILHCGSGLVVFHLLSLSWITVVFSLPSCHRFTDGTKILGLLPVVQTYIVFAFAFTILIKAGTFGSNPECNRHAAVVLFRPFSALNAGRILGCIVVVAVVTFYTGLTVWEYMPPQLKYIQLLMRIQRRVMKTGPKPDSPDFEIRGDDVEPGFNRHRQTTDNNRDLAEGSKSEKAGQINHVLSEEPTNKWFVLPRSMTPRSPEN